MGSRQGGEATHENEDDRAIVRKHLDAVLVERVVDGIHVLVVAVAAVRRTRNVCVAAGASELELSRKRVSSRTLNEAERGLTLP